MKRITAGVLLVGLAQASCAGQSGDEGTAPSSLLSDAKTRATMGSSISASGLDCSSFKSYTAALATHAVDCLGTIRPDSFSVNAENILERNFTSCPLDAQQLSNIDSLLLLQRREARLPGVRACMAGAYADYVRGFAETGVTECPTWKKEATLNEITASVIDRVLPTLDELQAASSATTLQFPADLEVENLYITAFESDHTGNARDSAAAGRACAAGFAGFVLEADHNAVVTDPVAWLSETVYPTFYLNPYLRNGYYHPMSYYGRGQHWGSRFRYEGCPDCPPEMCSYYTGVHKLTRLQLDCIVDSEPETCNSYCGPPLPG